MQNKENGIKNMSFNSVQSFWRMRAVISTTRRYNLNKTNIVEVLTTSQLITSKIYTKERQASTPFESTFLLKDAFLILINFHIL